MTGTLTPATVARGDVLRRGDGLQRDGWCASETCDDGNGRQHVTPASMTGWARRPERGVW